MRLKGTAWIEVARQAFVEIRELRNYTRQDLAGILTTVTQKLVTSYSSCFSQAWLCQLVL